jgi:hypothetical protein
VSDEIWVEIGQDGWREAVPAEDGAIADARRRTPPPCEGLAGLRYKYQDSSATVTNPGLNPVETNAKLAGYHQTPQPVKSESAELRINASRKSASPLCAVE